MPRIGWNGEVRVIASHGSFRQVELAEENGASGLQPGDHCRVKGRDMIRQCLGPSHSADAFGKAQVFDCHRYPMQRTAVCPGTNVTLCQPGLIQSVVSHHGSIALITSVELGDALEECSRHFHRRELLRLYQGSEFGNGMEI